MVDRVNGGPLQGTWFSADVRFIDFTTTNGGTSFLTELLDSPTGNNVNGKLEQALEAIATRGTVIGLNVTGANTFSVIVDYAQAYDDAAVQTEVEGLIDGITDLSGTSIIEVTEGFVANVLGTPA